MDNNSLTHHGIKGQRWGFRRFQTKTGSLTALGRKRYGSEKKGDGDSEKTKESSKPASTKPKTAMDMTNEELQSAIKNMELQQRYNQLYSQLNPQKISKGREFLEKSIIPATQEAGKTLIRDTLLKVGKKSLGLDNDVAETAYDKLKKEADKLDMQVRIKEAKRKLSGKSDDDIDFGKVDIDKLSGDQLKDLATKAENRNKVRQEVDRTVKERESKETDTSSEKQNTSTTENKTTTSTKQNTTQLGKSYLEQYIGKVKK